MSAVSDYDFTGAGRPQPGLAVLLEAATAAVGQLADGTDLDRMADRDAAAVMGTLTTLVGRLDGLRVQVARVVRDRQICGLRGARNLAGWLRADARLADGAWKLTRLAAAGPNLPKITALLDAGTISLAQAATAFWQIAQLPDLPVPPAIISPPEPSGALEPCDTPGPRDTPGPCDIRRPHDAPAQGPSAGQPSATGDGTADPCADDAASGAGPSSRVDPADSASGPGHAELRPGVDPSGGEAWAGLWRAGDVHAAADELFATFLPGLGGGQLRQLGAHLREAADTQDRTAGDCDDTRTKSQRWADVLPGSPAPHPIRSPDRPPGLMHP